MDDICLLCELVQGICFFLFFFSTVLIIGKFLSSEYPYWSFLEMHAAVQVNSWEFSEDNLEREYHNV